MKPQKPQRLDYLDEVLIKRINTMVFLSHEYPKSFGYRRDAGLALLMLRGNQTGRPWFKLVRRYCKLSRSQAYRLMEFAAGKSLEALRRVARDWKRKSRKDKWLAPKAPRLKRVKPTELSLTQGAPHGQNTEVRLPRGGVVQVRHKAHDRKP